ncbi:MAG: hypothetical protein A2600_02565 [Candidatus Lambdaproteobacteria bacterium RIFOXYD1_FULL_56_27]|uniref:Uncharacterized protein n=1 Tax=Candidatus Lambdaproteobacteria bacterium RIFOXYD2_FULL_56_26 TaxID=1817773 RepID=A0A1F6H2Z8_9PROT|nr:MAG: hypothetical protein A2426_09605 [Candidatus Lambdaproteobacteria bacterium RIFOXYC1_FULL_56_13]OGH04660.1 MAG: hypothetical protein A2557_06630 [Candidatus Lambdaproteobacteria bacterium RIFOXYD2_FULL_56_26]OGH09124.1 MAG: hypothetical protein A2600_02565 [Candidatus Lambdaproteobacteria bacterium RIFOXYD1_FULL_56_27]
MKVLVERVPNLEGLLKVAYDGEPGKEKYFLQSGRTLHQEGRLFGKYPLEAVQHTQTLSAKSGVAHGIAAVLALENYLQWTPTYNGQKMRQILLHLSTLHSHLHHFYFEVLPDYLNQKHFKGQGLLRSTYYPTLALREKDDQDLSPEAAKQIFTHLPQVVRTLAALQQAMALLGGKYPVVMNLIPGGVANTNLGRAQGMKLLRILESAKEMVEEIWPTDIKTVIAGATDLLQSSDEDQQLISFGSLPIENGKEEKAYFSPGVYVEGKLEPLNVTKITESYVDTYYRPADNRSLSNDLIYDLNKKKAHTWIKAARYETDVALTGPLARLLITHYGGGNVQVSDSIAGWIENLGLSIDKANSGAARLLAGAFEGRYILQNLFDSLLKLDFTGPLNQRKPFAFKGRGIGMGMVEAPGGALLHQVYIEGGKITGYRIVAPSNWNLSPGDEFGKTGLLEAGLNRMGKFGPLRPETAIRLAHSYYAQALDATQ